MNKGVKIARLGILSIAFSCLGVSQGGERGIFTAEEISQIESLSPLPAPPPSPSNLFADNPKAAHFGQLLFFEPRLSSNGEISCASCHNPELGFSDAKPLAMGIGEMDRHSPSIINQAYQRWFFWDGRADSLWAQSLQPLQSKIEMNATPALLLKVIAGDAALKSSYETVFGSISKVNLSEAEESDEFLSQLGKSLEAYQRLLISKDSPFDQFVSAGMDKENSPISQSAQRGLKIFVGKGQCFLCHSGPTFSDGEFHNIGLPEGSSRAADTGRFKGIRVMKEDRFNALGKFSDSQGKAANKKTRYVTQKMSNLGEFKTPTLRDIANTAPYMHDGRFSSLREVLDHYSELKGQPDFGHREETLTPLKLTDSEKEDLEAFLRTLTGAPINPLLLKGGESIEP